MEFTDKPIHNLLNYNGINSSNAVYDSGGSSSIDDSSSMQSNGSLATSAQQNGYSQISALVFMVAPFSLIFLFCVTGK